MSAAVKSGVWDPLTPLLPLLLGNESPTTNDGVLNVLRYFVIIVAAKIFTLKLETRAGFVETSMQHIKHLRC